MGKKLFVGGLAKSITEGQLRELCEPLGDIDEAKVIYDRETGQSRGFAFVTFFNNSEADNAISSLDGQELEGNRLVVNEARPSDSRPRSPFKPHNKDQRFGSKGGKKGHGGRGRRY